MLYFHQAYSALHILFSFLCLRTYVPFLTQAGKTNSQLTNKNTEEYGRFSGH